MEKGALLYTFILIRIQTNHVSVWKFLLPKVIIHHTHKFVRKSNAKKLFFLNPTYIFQHQTSWLIVFRKYFENKNPRRREKDFFFKKKRNRLNIHFFVVAEWIWMNFEWNIFSHIFAPLFNPKNSPPLMGKKIPTFLIALDGN